MRLFAFLLRGGLVIALGKATAMFNRRDAKNDARHGEAERERPSVVVRATVSA
jgi:hypothetical protein